MKKLLMDTFSLQATSWTALTQVIIIIQKSTVLQMLHRESFSSDFSGYSLKENFSQLTKRKCFSLLESELENQKKKFVIFCKDHQGLVLVLRQTHALSVNKAIAPCAQKCHVQDSFQWHSLCCHMVRPTVPYYACRRKQHKPTQIHSQSFSTLQ